MCPAVGQGALAIETRAGFDAARSVGSCRHAHRGAGRARPCLGALGGGCQVPIGAHATVTAGRVRLLGLVAAPDGSEVVRAESEGPSTEAAAIGSRLGADLLALGARKILDGVYGVA